MNFNELPPGKLYYSIGEVAELFDVNASLIRFWEKEFDLLKPTKNKKGNRLFTRQDIENLKLIYHLVKEKGYTLQGARDHLKSVKKLPPQEKQATLGTVETVEALEKIRKMLTDLRNSI